MNLTKILNDAGVPCVDDSVPPYKNRSFSPQGVMCHHTVSSPPAVFPSLGVVKYGRSDLPGPLCQLLLGRGGAGYRTICNGYANHAGSASVDAYHRWSSGQPPYRATSREHTGNGNYYFIGIEAENNGTGEPWSDAQIDLYVRGCAALCNHFGWDPFTTVWQHGEWTSTKIDTAFINPRIGWDEFRDSVWMAMVDDKPNPTPQETNRMIAVVIRPDNNKPHAMYADGMLDKISSVNVFTGMPTIGLASPLSTHDWNSMVGVNKKCRTARGHNPDYITKID